MRQRKQAIPCLGTGNFRFRLGFSAFAVIITAWRRFPHAGDLTRSGERWSKSRSSTSSSIPICSWASSRASTAGAKPAFALQDIFTRTNFLIALFSALIGYVIFEFLRRKL